jgi:hypothetical protein
METKTTRRKHKMEAVKTHLTTLLFLSNLFFMVPPLFEMYLFSVAINSFLDEETAREVPVR